MGGSYDWGDYHPLILDNEDPMEVTQVIGLAEAVLSENLNNKDVPDTKEDFKDWLGNYGGDNQFSPPSTDYIIDDPLIDEHQAYLVELPLEGGTKVTLAYIFQTLKDYDDYGSNYNLSVFVYFNTEEGVYNRDLGQEILTSIEFSGVVSISE